MAGNEDSAKKSRRGGRNRDSSLSEGEGRAEEALGELVSDFSQVHPGLRLEAMDKYGKWYVAKVVELEENDKEVLVHFERWSSRYDELISISSGRLRQLSLARLKELEKEKEKIKKELKPGDRIQAKWVDGRMYFGKVVKVHEADVNVLFDDGVEYTAPVVSVRKRPLEKNTEYAEESCHPSVIEGRKQRAEKRKRRDEGSSQTSPLSSPLSSPQNKIRCNFFDSDSTGTESDFDELKKMRNESISRSYQIDNTREQTETKALTTSLAALKPHVKHKSVFQEMPKTLPPLPRAEAEPSPGQQKMAESQMKFSPLLTPLMEESSPAAEKDSEMETTTSSTLATLASVTPQKATLDQASPETPLSTTSSSNQKAGSGPKPRMVRKSSKDTVATRTRAQTKSKNVTGSRGERKTKRVSGSKVATKGLVIELDHNEFKCKEAGCTKSFRKQSLLESHIKHYHSPPPVPKPRAARGKGAASGARSKVHSPQPTKSPQSSPLSTTHTESKTSPSKSPESSKQPSLGGKLDPQAPPSSHIAQGAGAEQGREERNKMHQETSALAKESIDLPAGKKPSSSSSSSGTSLKHMKQVKVEITKRQGSHMTPSRSAVLSITKGPTILEGKMLSRDPGTSQQTIKKHTAQATGVKSHLPEEEKEEKGLRHHSTSSVCDQPNDDVVHCMCGNDIDEGFMIQCEQCLCWQHGDCIGIRSNLLPKRYICYICSNPPGLRNRLKYKYSHNWYGGGTLPSVSGGPHFPASLNRAVLLSHDVTDSLYKVKKMMHSSDVKLQAASNSHHPYLKQWAKECSHYDKDMVLSYLINQLLPVSYQPVDGEASNSQDTRQDTSQDTRQDTSQDTRQDTSQDTRQDTSRDTRQDTSQDTRQDISRDTGMSEDAPMSQDTTVPQITIKLEKDLDVLSPSLNDMKTEVQDQTGSKNRNEEHETGVESGCQLEDEIKLENRAKPETVDETDRSDDSQSKRELRNSTLIQKNAVYHAPRRSRKAKDSSPSATAEDCMATPSSSAVSVVGGNENDSSMASQGDGDKGNRQDSLLAQGLTHPPTDTKKISNSGAESAYPIPIPLQSYSHVSPVAAVGSSVTNATSHSEQAEMMEIVTINDDEFGVSEIPVFAMEANKVQRSVASLSQSQLLAPLSVAATSSATVVPSPGPSSFSPSVQSAFKPVTPFKSKPTANSSSIPAPSAAISKPVDPRVGSKSPSKLGTEIVTLGEFAEAFVKSDTTNWFRRMKLLDHIEMVQDNVQEWLEVIEKKIDEIPEDAESLENYEKFLAEVHSTINKLSTCTVEPKTNS